MGRKSVPYIDESALLRLSLRDAPEHEPVRLSFADDDMDGEIDVMTAPAAGGATLPGHLTLEHLYRRNRNRARLIGLLRAHRSCHGASIVVLMTDADPEGDMPMRDALGWIVRPQDSESSCQPALQFVH